MTQSQDVNIFNPLSFFEGGFCLGSADLIQGGTFGEVVGGVVVTLLCAIRDGDGKPPVKKIVIILPPIGITKYTEDDVFSELSRAAVTYLGTDFSEHEMSVLHRVICVVHSTSLEVSNLIMMAQELGGDEHQAIVIADASQYRDNSITLSENNGVSAVRLAEDRWVPHVVSICRHLVSIVKSVDGYGLIHVLEVPAQKPDNEEQLMSIDDCYVAVLTFKDDPAEVFYSQAQHWRAMVLQGKVQEVKDEISTLAIPDVVKNMHSCSYYEILGMTRKCLNLLFN